MKSKSSAPALERGIEALRILNENGPLVLEKLSERSGIPKSSLLRIMETLEGMNMVHRDPVSRCFESTVAIVPVKQDDRIIRSILGECMRKLCLESSLTTEWYVPNQDKMVLADRCEPENKVVNIKAKIGFERYLNGELEAVARVALANSMELPEKPSFWVYCAGKMKHLKHKDAEKMIRKSAKSISDMDTEYNTNGFRRYAAPVKKTDGKLVGILALAESYSPDNDKYIKKTLDTLRKAAADLESKTAGYL